MQTFKVETYILRNPYRSTVHLLTRLNTLHSVQIYEIKAEITSHILRNNN